MMSLEEKLLRIVELRKSGKDDAGVAAEFGVGTDAILSYERAVKRTLEQALANGAKDSLAVAQLIQVSPLAAQYLLDFYGTSAPQTLLPQMPFRSRREYRASQIRAAISDGALNVEDVSQKTGLAVCTIRQYSCKEKIELGRGFQHNKKMKVRVLAREGSKPREIMELVGMSHYGVMKILREDKLPYVRDTCPADLPRGTRGRPRTRKPHVDALVLDGSPLEEMAELDGVTREAMRQYIHRTGQYTLWRASRAAKRSEPARKQETIRQLLNVLQQRSLHLAYQTSWAQGKAEEYLQSISVGNRQRPDSVPREDLVMIFEEYQRAKDSGENSSFGAIGAAVGRSATTARNVLKAVGLPSLNYTVSYQPRSPWPTELFVEVGALGLTCADTAYFCGERTSLVAQRMYSAGLKFKTLRSLKQFGREGKLTYRLASQIYEAQDLGFQCEEIADLLHQHSVLVAHAIEKRDEIAPAITKAIEKIYGCSTDLPYLENRVKKNGEA